MVLIECDRAESGPAGQRVPEQCGDQVRQRGRVGDDDRDRQQEQHEPAEPVGAAQGEVERAPAGPGPAACDPWSLGKEPESVPAVVLFALVDGLTHRRRVATGTGLVITLRCR
ncbi:hypothetical protein GCM10009533_45260 [Saccharopolyspora spinosporotrichia]|uniref:Uncharacterized protein n=1 Tax=Saccharopolyspora erythraea TaxID=1836 RepID=A0ABN1DEP6_SACER|nr:hypothetical protein JQX30_24425 [Saccharopolyspora erythraea]